MLLALAFSFNACSGDDDQATENRLGGTVSFKIDGVRKTFKTISVNKQDVNDVDDDRLTVTASDGGAENLIQFEIYENEVGPNMHYYFSLAIDGVNYSTEYDTFNNIITINDDETNTIKGSFAGKVGVYEGNKKTITDGVINITYQY